MRAIKTGLIAVFLFFVALQSMAQNIVGSTDKKRYDIGDVIELRFEVPFSEGEIQEIIYNKGNNDTLELQATTIDTISQNGKTILKYRQCYMSFISGNHTVGDSLCVRSQSKSGEKLYRIIPASIEIMQYSIDTTKAEVRDIKGLQEEPFTISEIMPLIYVFLALIALGVGAYFLIGYLRNRPVGINVVETPKVYIAPHIKALQALEELRLKRLSERGLKKQYYSELTDILRSYIEERFSVQATEMTTTEICSWLNTCKQTELATNEIVEEILQTADYVKFAKHCPDEFTDQKIWRLAKDYINSTKEEPNKETTQE